MPITIPLSDSERRLVDHLESHGNPINNKTGYASQDKFLYHGNNPTQIWPIPDRPGWAIKVDDGDTHYEYRVNDKGQPIDKDGNPVSIQYDENYQIKNVDGAVATRYRYIDTRELGMKSIVNGKETVLSPDPGAPSQALVLENAMKWAVDHGYTITTEGSNYGNDMYERPIIRTKFINNKTGDVIDWNALAIKRGYTEAGTNLPDHKRPDGELVNTRKQMFEWAAEAQRQGLGIYSDGMKLASFEKEIKDARKPIPFELNSKLKTNPHYDLSKKEHKDKVKIGDVWLNIPPTHLLVSQLRTSYAVPIIGFESRPITSSLTNRIVVRTNLIFEAGNTDNLKRLLVQFRHTPINIIRSRDIFEKIAGDKDGNGEATWLYAAYGQTGSYCVPVTMDEYTLYTIEGHPGAIGCSMQFSLFNFSAYFHQDTTARMQYYKYADAIWHADKNSATVSTLYRNGSVRVKADGTYEKILQTTFDLEESIHPYNFMIEHELRKPAAKYNIGATPSAITIYKINKDETLKEFNQKNPDKEMDASNAVDIITQSSVSDIAHSISIVYQNTFTWQPLLGYSQPSAQYVGPGNTTVNINIKTNNKETIKKVLKTYNEFIKANHFGFYDDRYQISSALIDFAECNILSLQNVVVSNIETKPDWRDINITFNKSAYESVVKLGNDPIKLDKYWGLGRIADALEGDDLTKAVNRLERLTEDKSVLHKLQNPNRIDIRSLQPNFIEQINRNLQYLEGLTKTWNARNSRQEITYSGTLIGKELIDKGQLEIISDPKEELNNLKQKYEVNPAEVQPQGIAGTLYTIVKNAVLPDGMNPLYNTTNYNKVVNAAAALRSPDYKETLNGNGIILRLKGTKDQRFIEWIRTVLNGTAKFDNETTATDKALAKLSVEVKQNKEKDEVLFKVTGKDSKFKENPNTAKVKEEIFSQMKKDIEQADKDGKFLAKPFAGHRYIDHIDDFVSYSTLFSKTMGYWFHFDQVENGSKYTDSIEEAAKKAIDPYKDSDAFKAVAYKDTANYGYLKEVQDYDPLSVPKAIIKPCLRKDPREYETAKDGSKKYQLPLCWINTAKIEGTDEFAFNTLSDVIMIGNYYAKDTEMGQSVANYLNSQETRESYEFKTAELNTVDVYDKNTRIGLLLPGSNQLYKPSNKTMLDISSGLFNDSNKVDDPTPSNASTLAMQKVYASMNCDPSSTTYLNQISTTTAPPQMIPSHAVAKRFGNASVSTTQGSTYYKGNSTYEETKKYANEAGGDKNVTTEVANMHLINQLPTVGLENAFPTFKMYVIHDDTSDFKYNALDTYWDYRLVQDLIVVRDKNNPAHILKARVIVDPRYVTTSDHIMQRLGPNGPLEYNTAGRVRENIGTDKQFSWNQGRSPLRQGMRICVKLGYHSDPRLLDTVFIGTITSLNGRMETGVYDLEAQGDGRELTVPPTTQSKTIQGQNYGDIISMMLRTNPNVIHFGKVYGSWIERLSRRHKLVAAYILDPSVYIKTLMGTGLGVMAATIPSRTIGLIGAMAVGSVAVGAANARAKEAEHDWINTDVRGAVSTKIGDMLRSLGGNIYNYEKAGFQVTRHFAEIFKAGHNPVDNNIFAPDIWAGNAWKKINLGINNQKSIWDIMTDIRRTYPNFALDVRPYGSRSTIYLGPLGFNYYRTDDPLLAMAPSLNELNRINYTADTFAANMKEGIRYLGPERNKFGDMVIKKGGLADQNKGIAPFIPFVKHHVASSYENIIHNGIKGTPERGWNSVVVTAGEPGKPSEPEEIVADMNIYPGAIRRKYENITWTTDSRVKTQYSMGLLKEGVEKLYGGILILKGNPKIEPYDKIYVYDNVNRMYGWIQAETVIHKFDNEMGYTTHIVPNMVCSVNNSCYLTQGDIMKKTLVNRVKNMSALDIAEVVGFTALGFFGSPLAALGVQALYETMKQGGLWYYRNKTQKEEIAKAQSEGRALPQDVNETGYMLNTFQTFADMKVDQTTQTYEFALGYAARIWRDSGSTKEMFTKAKKYTVEHKEKAVKAAKAIVEQKKMAANIAAIIKKYEENMAALVTEGNPSVRKKALDEMFAAMDEAGIKNARAVLGKNPTMQQIRAFQKANPGVIETAMQKATGATEEMAGKMFTSKGIAKFGGLTAAYLAMSAIEATLLYFNSVIVKAATRHHAITVDPVWSKDSYLMPGLDGYKNNDMWLHMKGLWMAAKEVYKDATDAARETYDVWNYEDSSNVVPEGSVQAATFKPDNVPSTGRYSSPTSGSTAISDDEINKALANLSKHKGTTFQAIQPVVEAMATKYNVEVPLINAIIHTESGFTTTALSHAGAIGLMQLMPSTARGLSVDPYTIEGNIEGGVKFIASLIKEQGSVEKALAYYNGGLRGVTNPARETRLYVPKVMKYYAIYKADANKQAESLGQPYYLMGQKTASAKKKTLKEGLTTGTGDVSTPLFADFVRS